MSYSEAGDDVLTRVLQVFQQGQLLGCSRIVCPAISLLFVELFPIPVLWSHGFSGVMRVTLAGVVQCQPYLGTKLQNRTDLVGA